MKKAMPIEHNVPEEHIKEVYETLVTMKKALLSANNDYKEAFDKIKDQETKQEETKDVLITRRKCLRLLFVKRPVKAIYTTEHIGMKASFIIKEKFSLIMKLKKLKQHLNSKIITKGTI